jgi:hypothetical protein
MTATFELQHNGEKRIMVVKNVRDQAHARQIGKRIVAVRADTARLIALEDHLLVYTAHEVETERNLLGGPRRYSTGERTVTIPESTVAECFEAGRFIADGSVRVGGADDGPLPPDPNLGIG